MVGARFISSDGSEDVIDIAEGMSLMEGALRGGIDGIDADCGGELACATCHVYVAPEWLSRVPPASEDERDMLEYALHTDERSRLCCQIKMAPDLDGIVVNIPLSQK
jgi:2Fe-2S ferredoxin